MKTINFQSTGESVSVNIHTHTQASACYEITRHGILRKIPLIILLVLGFMLQINAQNNEKKKQAFETQMKAYITQHLNEKVKDITQNEQDYDEFDSFTHEDIESIAREQAKTDYIHKHMKEYLNTYFSTPQAMVNADTLVCDNGGFEEDFQNFSGFISSWHNGYGGANCNPLFIDPHGDSIPLNFTPVPIPYNNRFEIVGAGYDSAFGIKQVKFGNKAARINDKVGPADTCYFFSQIDRLEKRFKVTEENRDFTVWYAVALQNPSGHRNQQPFFNISCDRDQIHELCFDADFLKCIDDYADENCMYKKVKVLDWSCHTFKIPAEFIDSIATLTITVGDCARDGDFGMAYIDGICEPCDSSALGAASLNTINYLPCIEDIPPEVAKVCGRFTLPTISSNCDNIPDPWQAISITIPNYDIENVQIFDNNTFCFDFPITNFTSEDCLDIYVEITFSNGTDTLPNQLSNTLEICQSEYDAIDCNGEVGPTDVCDIVVDIQVGSCQSNGTGEDGDADQTPNISDDYYYIYVSLYDPYDLGWSIDRHLVDPYPNENNVYTIADGVGDTVSMQLGPFLIQEGDWGIEFNLPGCNFTEYIEAPDYCSGCEEFRDAEIGNVECISNPPEDDTWSFTIKVPNQNSPAFNPLIFNLNNLTLGGSDQYSYNENHIIGGFSFNPPGCIVFGLQDPNNLNCISGFTICPPMRCSEDCDLDVYVEEMECIFDERMQQYTGYNVLVDISGINDNEEKACISYSFSELLDNPIQWGALSNGLWSIGTFDSDIYLMVSVCPKEEDCPCNDPACNKIIYIPKPNCMSQQEIENREQDDESEKSNRFDGRSVSGELLVIPNPFSSDEVLLRSTMEQTAYRIYDSSGKLIIQGEFKGSIQRIKLNISQGIYFIKYTDNNGDISFVKMIKL